MKRKTKTFLVLFVVIILSAQFFSVLFLNSFEKELKSYQQDKQFIEQSLDLYALACSSPHGASDKECKELTKKVHITYERMNNNYQLVNLYVRYVAN